MLLVKWGVLSVLIAVVSACTRSSSFNSSVEPPERPLPFNGQVTYTCQVNTGVLFWTSTRFPEQTVVSTSDSDIPISVNNVNSVTANRMVYVEENCLTSQIMFSGTLEEIEGLQLKCEDASRNLIDNITIVTAIVPNSPSSLLNISQTFQSVYLQWTPPTDDGGNSIQYYMINVTGGPSDCTDGVCVTMDTSYNVTGLMFNVSYTFTVSANNSVGASPASNKLTVLVPGEVPDPVSNITYCIRRTVSNDQLLLQWTCPVILTNPSTTPPITRYTAMNGNTLLCPPVMESDCSSSVDYCPIDVTDGQMINVSVTAINGVGNTTASNVFININLDLLNVTVINVTSDSVTIQCTTSYMSSTDRYCNVTLTSPAAIADQSIFEESTKSAIVSFYNLAPGIHTFTASLVDGSDQRLSDTCITVESGFTIIAPSTSMTTSTVSMTFSSNMPTNTSVSATVSSSTSDVVTSSSTGGDRGKTVNDQTPAVIGGAAAGGGVLLLLVIVIVLVTVYCVYRKKKGHTKVDFGGGSGQGDPDGPIALVDRQVAVPETGQALYQDPDTIQREKAPTGDMYAVPDKPRRNAPTNTTPAPHQPELATYQDPNTIQREQAPTGDLYALPDKKPVYSQVNKENKTGIVYAELGLENTAGAGPGYSANTVLYADVNVNK